MSMVLPSDVDGTVADRYQMEAMLEPLPNGVS
jgi:hypothetical protein